MKTKAFLWGLLLILLSFGIELGTTQKPAEARKSSKTKDYSDQVRLHFCLGRMSALKILFGLSAKHRL